MKLDWTKGLEDDIAEEVKQSFRSAGTTRRRLSTLIEEKVASARAEARSKQVYENPNWSYKIADLMGYERALYEIISLILEDDVTK